MNPLVRFTRTLPDMHNFTSHNTSFLLALSVLLLALTVGSNALAQDIASLDEWIEAQMEEHQIPGLAVGIVDGDRVVKARGYGFANVELEVAVSEHTIFQTASVGKQFTATAALLLVEDGRLDLDDPVTDHLEELPDSWRFITVRNLLNHTSGIPNYGPPLWDFQRDYTEDDFLKRFSNFTLQFPPGEEWNYSNTGYAILGALISRITGAHWSEFVQERIFEPTGMTSARLISEEDIVPNRAAGYRLSGDELKNQEWVSPSANSTADGALYVSMLDMVQWVEAIFGSSIVNDESRRVMWTPTRLNDGEEIAYGLGWFLQEVAGRPAVGHSGGWQGFASDITHFPEDSLTVILFANRTGAAIGVLREEIAVRYRPETMDVSDTSTPMVLPQDELEAYSGHYWFPDGRILEFSPAENGISVSGLGTVFLLIPYNEDSFFMEEHPQIRMVFRRNTDTNVVEGVRYLMFRGRKIR